MPSYNQFDIIIVPFPFTDRNTSKRRPSLVLSNTYFNNIQHYICAMITTKSNPPWPGDIKIKDYKKSGLNHPSIIRFKLFTLDLRLIKRKLGGLSSRDKNSVRTTLNKILTNF